MTTSGKRERFGSRGERRAAYAFIAPTLFCFLVIAAYPIVLAMALSFRRTILVFHEDRFIGLTNYAFLLKDPRFHTALTNTLTFAAIAVPIELGLGLLTALLLDASFRGKSLFRATILLPWAIPTVVAGKTWAWLFRPDVGVVTRMWPGHPVDWLGTPGYAMGAAILVDVWKTTPFVALIVLAGLMAIPQDLYDAAAIDGASRFRVFRSITLPLLVPTLALAFVLRALDALRVFDAIYVLTGGGPANTTETLSIYAYKTLLRSSDFGYGSTLSVATFACVMVVGALYLGLFGVPGREPQRRDERR